MQTTNKKIACPQCGREIELVPKKDDPARVEGWCGHGTGNVQPVIETDSDTPSNVLQSFVSALKPKNQENSDE